MSLETYIPQLLVPVFGARVWWDTLPSEIQRPALEAPHCILQVVGGRANQYVENDPSEWHNARVQFFTWGGVRTEVSAAARALQALMEAASTEHFVVTVYGAAVNDYNEVLDLRGARQDFGIWYKDPLPTP